MLRFLKKLVFGTMLFFLVFSCASTPESEYDEVSDVTRGFSKEELERRDVELEVSEARQRNPFIISPPGPMKPDLPEIINQIADLNKIIVSFEDSIEASALVLQAVESAGWKRNQEGIKNVQDVTQWWRNYFNTVRIQTNKEDFTEEMVQDQLILLEDLDKEYTNIINALNQAIESTSNR